MQSDPRNPRSHDGPVHPARLGVRLHWVLAIIIGEEKIMALPLNGRQFISLALLSPNVTAGGESVQQNQVRLNQIGGFSASGNRTNNNGFMLDGITNLDPDYMSLFC